jgi:hypothetical protein
MRFLLPLLLMILSSDDPSVGGCLCASAPSVEEALKSAAVVFAGIVEKVEDPDAERIRALPAGQQEAARKASRDAGTFSRIATFRVMKRWKGEHTTREVQLRSNGSACSLTPQPGHSYLVYGRRSVSHPDQLMLSICSRTFWLVCGSEDLKKLGKPIESYEEIDQAQLIAREQPFAELGLECIKAPLLIGERPAIEARCYYDVDAVIDENGAVRDFKGLTDRSKPACPALDLKVIQAWRFRPATLDGTPVQVQLRRITSGDPVTVSEDARSRAEAEAP